MTRFSNCTVVVPVDLTDPSFAAVDVALDCVDAPSSIHVIHVLPDVSSGELEQIWDQVDPTRREHDAYRAIESRLAEARYRGIQIEVVFGSPGEAIVASAQRLGADLIVMPSHGRRRLARFLLGSVAERVIRLAHCSVLVTKGPDRSDEADVNPAETE